MMSWTMMKKSASWKEKWTVRCAGGFGEEGV